MMKFIKTILFLVPVFLYAQNTKITLLDARDKKPLNGIQILSENGSLIANSNIEGKFEFDKSILKQSDIKSIMFYDSQYLPVEYKLDEIPAIVFLEKMKLYELEPVVIVKKLSKKYFTISGYIRSWKLVNNKLVQYGDALMEYHIPYKKTNNDLNSGIKNFAIEYRTFKIDSIKQKSRIVSISSFDAFFNYLIPSRDLLEKHWKHYKTELNKDSLYNVLEDDKNIGYLIKDESHNLNEISVNENFEGEKPIKLGFWKLSGGYKNFEKWVGNGETRHLSYSFSSQKKIIETKVEGIYNAVETINEIFINDKIIYNDKKPKKYKTRINKEKSFYNTKYWKEQIEKHPLPSSVKEQLINVNENENED